MEVCDVRHENAAVPFLNLCRMPSIKRSKGQTVINQNGGKSLNALLVSVINPQLQSL